MMREPKILSAEDIQKIDDEYVPVTHEAGDVCIPITMLKDMIHSLRFWAEEIEEADERIGSLNQRMLELVKFIGRVES